MWTRQLTSVTKIARSKTSITWWKRTSSTSLDVRSDKVKRPQNFQLVIVGTGWAGYKMFTQCRKHLVEIEENIGRPVDLVVVSKRNHFLYTPLLASTTVGTLEFRSIMEPLRDNMLSHEDDFHLANVRDIDPEHKVLNVESAINTGSHNRKYNIQYDALVLACGSKPLTFGLPGVEEHAFFLKEIHHAQKIRNRILENFELATQPGVTPEEKQRLLHFVVVGGGPTGIEFCAELYDLVMQDLVHKYPETSKHLGVTLVDSNEILSGFDKYLRTVALRKIQKRNTMKIVKKNCIEVTTNGVTLDSGEKIPAGLVVWTAGVGPNELTKSLTVFEKSKRGNILTNQYCQVLGAAEKAQSQATYLTLLLRGKNPTPAKPYTFQSKGMMAYLGSYEGLFEAHPSNDGRITLTGWKAWFLWRSAYLTKLGSWRLRLQVPLDWLKAVLVGRDVSKF
ncbi:unnamed protein product [Peronospora belbahrii]|uniref:FAD/NAD(P)-binding domain-containing protein n=1 Tax=Peronospora belbahrii TaxID=622444 RepID=A0AAU9L049_9STRA|nr:unnamed protein product [Peronospora belbahrii]